MNYLSPDERKFERRLMEAGTPQDVKESLLAIYRATREASKFCGHKSAEQITLEIAKTIAGE